MANGFSNGVHRPRHDQINSELPEFGTGTARIAVHAVTALEPRTGLQSIRPDQPRIHGERQRGVGKAGMRTDLFLTIALALQQLAEFDLAGTVIFVDRVDTDRF